MKTIQTKTQPDHTKVGHQGDLLAEAPYLRAAVSHRSASDKHLQPLFGVDLKGLDQPRQRRRSEPVTSLDLGLGKF